MRDIPGYDGLYAITQDGKVWTRIKNSRNMGKGRWLSQAKARNGYMLVHMHKEGKRKANLVHRLVAITYIPNPEQKQCINHINGIRDDNRVENLEWCTYRENQIDLILSGRSNYAMGEKHPRSKITAQIAKELRAKYKPGIYTVLMLCEEYGLTRGIVENVVAGNTWKHVV